MKLARVVCVLFIVFLLSSCALITEEWRHPGERAFQRRLLSAKEDLRLANVGVETELAEEGDPFTAERTKQGSGVIFAEHADFVYVLTNQHVIDAEDASEVLYRITLSGKEEGFAGEFVAQSFSKDLAVLRFRKEDDTDYRLIDIEARADDALETGEFVFAVGNPAALDTIVTFGEFLGMGDIDKVDFPVIKHNAVIFTGHSGGALADIEGNLVGINTWGAVVEGLNMAVPLSEVRAWLEEIDFFESEILTNDATRSSKDVMP